MKGGKLKQLQQKKLMEQIKSLQKQHEQHESERQQLEQQILTLSATQVTLQMELTTLAKLMADRIELDENRWQEERTRLALSEENFRIIQNQVCNLPYSQNAPLSISVQVV